MSSSHKEHRNERPRKSKTREREKKIEKICESLMASYPLVLVLQEGMTISSDFLNRINHNHIMHKLVRSRLFLFATTCLTKCQGNHF